MKWTILLSLLLGLPLLAQQPEQPFTHTLLAPGLAASAPMTIPLRTVPARMILRNYTVGRGTARDIPNPNFAVMELQSGHVFTTVGGNREERVPGDFWTVDKGAAITFDNPDAQSAAVIRVTSFEVNP